MTTEYTTADLAVWRRYRRRCPGIVEIFLDTNPQLSVVHRTTPFIPPGTLVRIPIDPDLILGKPPPSATVDLWTDRAGYTI